MTVDNMKAELKAITSDETYRQNMLAGYQEVNDQLGGAGAPNHAARIMIELLSRKG
jgi:lipid-A-disaccharide synthase